jgi:hypothetical protein
MTDRPMTAKWHVEQDGEATHLHIELWNGFGLTITAWADDDAQPLVALRSNEHGEHDLQDCGFAGFRRFLDGAQGKPARRTRQVVAK